MIEMFLDRRIKLLGRTIPLWAFLLLTVLTASAAIIIIIQVSQQEQISVGALGLDYTSGEATVSGGTIVISYQVYEHGQTVLTEAYYITNNNADSLNMKLTALTPTASAEWSSVSYYKMTAKDSLGKSIMLLEYDGSVWSLGSCGLMNLVTGTIELEVHKGAGTTAMTLDQVFDVELTSETPDQGTYLFTHDHFDGAQWYFTGASLADGDHSWLGWTMKNRTPDYVLATWSGANYTSGSVQGVYNTIRYGQSVLFHATFGDIPDTSQCSDFYIHIEETDELVHVIP